MYFTSQLATILLLFIALLLSPLAGAQQTLFPAAIPLAVRSPYLSSWDHITNGTVFGQSWPNTYTPGQILGWTVYVRIDNFTYSFLGDPDVFNGTTNVTNIAVTPTQTVVTARAGPMQVNLTFLNPIERGDWVKQSIPFSYITFAAKSLDGSAHAVQVYTDVSGEWNSGNRGHLIQWSTTSNDNVIYHNVKLQTPAPFNEISNQAEWGNLYYVMKAGDNITYKIDIGDPSRVMFVQSGVLDNTTITGPHPIGNQFPVFAISRDFGTIQSTQAPFVWAVGYTTDPAISYTDLSGAPATQRYSYYKSKYSDDGALIVDFLNDFSNASSRAQDLDEMILQNATSISGPLGDLVSLAIAQVYGSTQLTIGTNAVGGLDTSDVMMFMKNIGGDIPNRVNAVETLYAAFPAFMFIDPSLGAPLLEPLFRLQAPSSNHSIRYAAADIGSNYPNVTGTNSTHNKGVEQTGNMLIMTYAHGRATGDGSLIHRYYPLLTSWADYLANSTLFINNQVSADGLSVSNQTNLAIKGIIAIQAMSRMSSVVGQAPDAKKYGTIASQLYEQWKNLALSDDQHLLAVYGQDDSWTLGYNMFADVWLGLNVVNSSVYEAHSRFIKNITSTSSFSKFGMPVDNIFSDTTSAISSWNLFVAAMTSDGDLRSDLIKNVHNRASYNATAGVFPLNYATSNGLAISGQASPAQGAMFAPLALKAPVLTIIADPIGKDSESASNGPSKIGAIVGGAIGGVAAVLIVIGAAVFLRRRRRLGRRKSVRSSFSASFMGGGPLAITTITPFNSIPLYPTHQGSDSDQQQLLSESTDTEAAPELHSLSSTLAPVLPRPRPVAPIPPGLSDKQLARIRTEALNPERTSSHQPSNSSQSSASPTVVTEPSQTRSSSETRRLQSQVELLRREMQQLRTERFEAPPSYTTGDV